MLTKLIDSEVIILTAEEEAALLAEWAAAEASTREESRVTGIRREARKRIISLLPDRGDPANYLEMENNIQARVSYLQRKEYKATASAAELLELEEAESIWLKIEDIRALSDQAEANGDTLEIYQASLDAKGY